MTENTDALNELQADVANESSVVDAAVVLIQGLGNRLTNILASSNGDDLVTQIQNLRDEVNAKSTALAQAVAEGTAAENDSSNFPTESTNSTTSAQSTETTSSDTSATESSSDTSDSSDNTTTSNSTLGADTSETVAGSEATPAPDTSVDSGEPVTPAEDGTADTAPPATSFESNNGSSPTE